MEQQLICFVCNNRFVDKIKHFNVKTLAKCQQVYDIRSRYKFKYANITLPLLPGGPEGYHAKCYKMFTALKMNDVLSKEYVIDKYVERQMSLKMDKQNDGMSNVSLQNIDIYNNKKTESLECTSSFIVCGSSEDVSEEMKTPKVEVSDGRICLICNRLQSDNGDFSLMKVTSIDALKSEATECKDLDLLQTLNSSQPHELWWHSYCRLSYGKNITIKSASSASDEILTLNDVHQKAGEDCLSSELDIKMDPVEITQCSWNLQANECVNGKQNSMSTMDNLKMESKCIFCDRNKKKHKNKMNKLVKFTSVENIRSIAINNKDLELLEKLDSMDTEHMWYHIYCRNAYSNGCVKKHKYEHEIEPVQYGCMNKEFCKFIQKEIIRNDKSIFLSLLNEIYKDTSQSKREKHTDGQLETKLNQTFDEELKIIEFNSTKIVNPINSEITDYLYSLMENEYVLQKAALSMRREILKKGTQNLTCSNLVKFFTTLINGASNMNKNPMIQKKAETFSCSMIKAILSKNTVKSGTHGTCEGCLSSNRRVIPLEKNLENYYSMLEEQHPQVANNCKAYLPKPVLCWECHKEFQNAIAFRNKIKQAHRILTTTNKSILQNHTHSFTKLVTTLNTSYDYVLYHDSVDIDVSVIDVQIKQEYVDESADVDVGVKDDSEQDFDDNITDVNNENIDVIIKDMNKDDLDVILKDVHEDDIDVIVKDVKEQDNDITETLDDIENEKDEDEKVINKSFGKGAKRKRKTSKKTSQSKTKIGTSCTSKHRWHYTNSTKCRLVEWSRKEIMKLNCYSKVLMKPHELTLLWERERKLLSYKTDLFKCELCLSTYEDESSLEVHMKMFHTPTIGDYECDVCHRRVQSKGAIWKHCIEHFYVYNCSLCSYKCFGRGDVLKHFKEDHGKALKCLKCNMKFGINEKKEFYKHYKLHTEYVCDYCGKKCGKKSTLISHMRHRHLPIVCEVCNARFSRIPALNDHKKLKHVKNPTETAYCVECDVQFDNEKLYKRHYKTSTKHVPKVINKYHPCRGCDKVFAYRWSMLKHYKYHHLQLRNFDCNICSRSYMCGYQLRQHIDTHHLNMPTPKDKVCDYCGRGFATKDILKNHIRTHTGARPFACERCPAAFGQRSALVTHVRKTHGVHIMYRDIPLPKDDTV